MQVNTEPAWCLAQGERWSSSVQLIPQPSHERDAVARSLQIRAPRLRGADRLAPGCRAHKCQSEEPWSSLPGGQQLLLKGLLPTCSPCPLTGGETHRKTKAGSQNSKSTIPKVGVCVTPLVWVSLLSRRELGCRTPGPWKVPWRRG